MCRELRFASAGALAALAFTSACLLGSGVRAQTEQGTNTESRSVWEGVYTRAQAERGRMQYESACGECHGMDLSGGRGAQPLKGEFMRYWHGYPLNSLFTRIKYTMPSGAPASLSDDAYLDVVAYLLQQNEFPTGGDELAMEMLESISIEGEEGPQPIPNYAFVRVVGCLAPGGGQGWTLSGASEPVRTRDAHPSRDQERIDSATKVLGDREFPLRSIYPDPDSLSGHKVEVKGFWIQGADEHINVNSLQTLAPSCG